MNEERFGNRYQFADKNTSNILHREKKSYILKWPKSKTRSEQKTGSDNFCHFMSSQTTACAMYVSLKNARSIYAKYEN